MNNQPVYLRCVLMCSTSAHVARSSTPFYYPFTCPGRGGNRSGWRWDNRSSFLPLGEQVEGLSQGSKLRRDWSLRSLLRIFIGRCCHYYSGRIGFGPCSGQGFSGTVIMNVYYFIMQIRQDGKSWESASYLAWEGEKMLRPQQQQQQRRWNKLTQKRKLPVLLFIIILLF